MVENENLMKSDSRSLWRNFLPLSIAFGEALKATKCHPENEINENGARKKFMF